LRNGEPLNLEGLIGQVANPPLEKVGALPIDMFYPQKDRMALMFALNNLVASPPFQVWRQGAPIDIEQWARSEDGVPNLSIIYTAHLDDEERIFITALILNKLKTWMRKQPGTSKLRLLFYMDEIFGYFPPSANPPTKKPLLTLLKQARAYGVGVLLATQNPVDLDYKGLSNMGFWAIGRLQTERDQERVRQGVEAALTDAGLGRTFGDLIAAVQKRVFLIHDIHRKRPELVHSRFVMSYLRGPITREEIRALPGNAGIHENGSAKRDTADRTVPVSPAPRREAAPAVGPASGAAAPLLPPPFKPTFYRRYGGERATPFVYVKASVRYKIGAASTGEATHQLAFELRPGSTAAELLNSKPIVIDERDLEARPGSDLQYADLPAFLGKDGARAIERVLQDRLDDFFETELIYDPAGKNLSEPGEDEYAFAARAGETPAAAAKRRTLTERLRQKRADLAVRRSEANGRKAEKWTSVGTTILGGILSGKKRNVPNLGGVMSKSRMESTAEQRVRALEDEIAKLEADLARLSSPDTSRFERRMVKPTRSDVHLMKFDIVWAY